MEIISLLNQKGGVGKSTIAVNLSVALNKMDKKVLLLDLDPQGDSTDYSGVLEEQEITTLEFLLEGKKNIIKTKYYDLIPSDITLSDFELKAVQMLMRESILKNQLGKIEGYDYCIIDCPPSLGLLSLNALIASNLILSPILLERFSLKGLSSLTDTLSNIKVINPEIKNKYVINKFNKSFSHNNENYEMVLEIIKENLLDTILRQDVKISKSQNETSNIFDYDKNAKSSIDFIDLAKEVIKLEK